MEVDYLIVVSAVSILIGMGCVAGCCWAGGATLVEGKLIVAPLVSAIYGMLGIALG